MRIYRDERYNSRDKLTKFVPKKEKARREE